MPHRSPCKALLSDLVPTQSTNPGPSKWNKSPTNHPALLQRLHGVSTMLGGCPSLCRDTSQADECLCASLHGPRPGCRGVAPHAGGGQGKDARSPLPCSQQDLARREAHQLAEAEPKSHGWRWGICHVCPSRCVCPSRWCDGAKTQKGLQGPQLAGGPTTVPTQRAG